VGIGIHLFEDIGRLAILGVARSGRNLGIAMANTYLSVELLMLYPSSIE
jgi:hypothetical protein